MPVEKLNEEFSQNECGCLKMHTEYQCFVSLLVKYKCNVPNIIYQLMIFRLGGFLLY